MIDTIAIAAISFASGVFGAAIGYFACKNTCKNKWSKRVEFWRSEAEKATYESAYFAREANICRDQLEKHRATRDRHNKAKRDKRAAGRKQP
jgi:hypothetical protein